MRRRAFVASLAAGATAGVSGCIGGGDVVKVVQRSITVQPGQGWVTEIPDVADPRGDVQFTAKATQPFDVYFFTSEEAFQFYNAYTKGEEPAETPSGHGDLSMTAVSTGNGGYGVATGESGSRISISESGPYYFVVDHSDYPGGVAPGDQADRLSVFLDLTVSESRLPF